ncbi:MAG TPA: SDR family NAD(P)-dependent oxidoreductase [Verrucomicrobiae bacterium]|nr:SDR family NAD(P)-dependent oxidoreductase [Verrucomicrobiae bacterium]
MDLGLRGLAAVVTGGSRGIGRAIALTLADEGASVAICARGIAGVEATLEELGARGVGRFGAAVDVSDAVATEGFVDAAAVALGRLDILVNNVGGTVGAGVVDSTDEEWQRTFDLNLFPAVRASRAAIPHMRWGGGGSIVNISSISGHHPGPGSQYATAKAAVIFLSRAMALELSGDGVRVNAVCPGSIVFPEGGWARFRERDPGAYRRFELDEFPAQRLGSAEEVARVVAFVASPAAEWVNGASIDVDGAQQRPGPFSVRRR